jgi:hypothetical protein
MSRTRQPRRILTGSLAVSAFQERLGVPMSFCVQHETELTIALDERAGHGGIWSRSIDVMGSGMTKVPVKFSFTVDADALVCAFGFPGMLPGGLSQAFPVINKQPPSDRGRRLFTFEAPEGVPYADDEAASLGMHYVTGCVLVFALCMALFARVFWQKRKQRKVLKALMAQSESDDVRGTRKTRYTDDS